LRQKIAIERIAGIFEKRLLPPVTPLRDVVRDAGNHKTEKAGHQQGLT
jgi:hypothetical protein